jgi:hypothetical protein
VLKKYLTILEQKESSKSTIINHISKSIKSDNLYVDFSVVCECGTPCEKIYVLVALIMSNIVLNNYSKNKKNACQHEKRSTMADNKFRPANF